MKTASRVALMSVVLVVVLVAAAGAGVAMYARVTGLRANVASSETEARAARFVRTWSVPQEIRERKNPVPLSNEVLAEGMAHYADHCASCHAADGSGNTEIGRGLYPKAPDMRAAATRSLTDGELFYVIEHGVRFTGMPGWSTGTEAEETSTWHLVHFIRRLPQLTAEELARVEELQPRSLEQARQEILEEQFLKGTDVAAPEAPATHHRGAEK